MERKGWAIKCMEVEVGENRFMECYYVVNAPMDIPDGTIIAGPYMDEEEAEAEGRAIEEMHKSWGF